MTPEEAKEVVLIRILELEDMLVARAGELNNVTICTICLSPDSCICGAPRWPIYQVLVRLKNEIANGYS